MNRSVSTLLTIAALLALGALALARLAPDTPGPSVPARAPRTAAAEATTLSAPGAATAAAAERAVAEPARVAVEAAAETAEPVPTRWLRGRVLAPDGRPEPRVQVAALALQADGTPGQHPTHEAVITDDHGRFALSPPAAARLALVARQPDCRPACTVLESGADAFGREHVLQLERGFAITGRVVRHGAPVAGAQLNVDLRFGTPGVFGVGSESFWIGGRLEEKHDRAETDANGAFALTGLGPYAHRLDLGVPTDGRHVLADFTRQATAPTAGMVLEIALAEIEVVVQRLGQPLAGARVGAHVGERGIDAESTHHPVLFAVPPHAEVKITVEHGASRPAERTITAPGHGQRAVARFELQPIERPDLLLQLAGATAADVAQVGVVFRPQLGFDDTEVTGVHLEGQDVFLVAGVPLDPGDCHVAVVPHGGSGASHHLLPAVGQVTLPARGTVHLRLELRLGGRVAFDIQSQRQGDWNARYRVLDAAGNEHASGMVFRSGNMAFALHGIHGIQLQTEWIGVQFGGKPRALDAADLARQHAVLEPGTYRVEVSSDGHAPWRGEIVVRAGETSSQRIDLVPE